MDLEFSYPWNSEWECQSGAMPGHLTFLFTPYSFCVASGLRYKYDNLTQYIQAPYTSQQIVAPCPYLGSSSEHTGVMIFLQNDGPEKWPMQALEVGSVCLRGYPLCAYFRRNQSGSVAALLSGDGYDERR